MKFFQIHPIAVLLAILLLCHTNMAAQKSTVTRNVQPFVPLEKTWWIQVNPLMLAEPEMSIGATGLYKISKYIGLALEANAYISRYDLESADGFGKYSGIRLRPEVKIHPNPDSKKGRGLYFAIQGLYKNTYRPREEWLEVSGGFSQLVSYKENKRILGGAVKFGWEITPGRSKKWMIDVFTGLGARNKLYQAKGLPNGVTINYDNNFGDFWSLDDNVNGNYPTISLGIKFGFRIGK